MAIVNKKPVAPIDPDARARTLSEAIKDPQGYGGVFQQAYVGLGQPAKSVDPNENRAAVTKAGTEELAEAFVDRFYEKTGKLPEADQVSNFVANNLTQGFAEKYITGGLTRESVKARMVDPFLEEIGAVKPQGSTSTEEDNASLSKKVDELFGQAEESGRASIARTFGPARQRALEDEASMPGRLRSGVSYARSSPVGQADEREANALSDLIGNIAQARAGGQFNLASQMANLNQQENQFTRNLGFQRQQMRNAQEEQERNLGLQRQQLSLSETLGRMQAEGRKPGTLDYLGLAFGGLGALGGLASGIGSMRKR